MTNEEKNCNCEGTCSCNQSCGQEYDHFGMTLWLAKKAKIELLKEKIKKRIEATQGKKLDKMADIAIEAITEHKKSSVEMEKKYEDLREKFNATMNE